jgi:hypothetical protein
MISIMPNDAVKEAIDLAFDPPHIHFHQKYPPDAKSHDWIEYQLSE